MSHKFQACYLLVYYFLIILRMKTVEVECQIAMFTFYSLYCFTVTSVTVIIITFHAL